MKRFLPLLMTVLLVASCGKSDSKAVTDDNAGSADSMAVIYYKLRTEGRFAEYVSAMHSCDGTTTEYKKGVENMLRQHQNEIEKEKKGISRVEALRSELHDGGKMANVFLRITYKDGACEEVIFPLVSDRGSWRIQ